jgi:hypothetical protein
VRRPGAAVLAALFLGGCGTLIHRPSDAIYVTSNPAGAEASIICVGGSDRGITPVKLVIPRKADGCNLTVSRDGYRPTRLPMERGFSWGYWTNFALSPILFVAVKGDDRDPGYGAFAAALAGGVGFLVDQYFGGKWDHEPEEVIVDLEREP